MKPWLSVVMPIHGGERHLGATLASVAAENPTGVEFLLYDSGDDNDAARRIAESYIDRIALSWRATPEILPWTEKTNLGVREAAAAHVCMLHQDDLWLPGHLDQVRSTIAENPGAAISIAPSRFVNADGHQLGDWRLPFCSGELASDQFVATLLVQNTIAIPSPVISRDAWLYCGGLDEALWYTADWDLYLKLAEQGPIVVRPKVTTAFRIHGSSLTMSGSRDANAFRKQFDIVLQRHDASLERGGDKRLRARAHASVEINCRLAKAAAGQPRHLWNAIGRLLRLGPIDALRYLGESRLSDRILSRLRARLVGVL